MITANNPMETLEKVPRTDGVEVCRLYISAGHNFFGHHGKPPGQNPMLEMGEMECVAGRGVRGDRFFNHQENYKGQITFFAREIYETLCEGLGIREKSLAVFRRNAITTGVDLNVLIGEEFQIQGIHFRGTEECRPCYWMDEAFAPGAFNFLKGRGGLRAEILSDGILRRINE